MIVQSTIAISSTEYYSCELTKRIPVKVSILTINGDTGFGILESDHGEDVLIQYVEELSQSSSIVSVRVSHRSKEVYWTRVVHRLNEESIYERILSNGCMSKLPILIENGIQYHVVLAPSQNALRNLIHVLRDRYDTVKIYRRFPLPQYPFYSNLTKKQKEAFELAYFSGYYEIPRKVTISDLAREIGIKRVAMQERLRRVEKQVMNIFALDVLRLREKEGE
ncbi:MAG: hypothetical protein BAJATHORv1_90049 [Candidatus Thorarchaeota archaeon]|nr:MAG: hypothetical protein BAJATHORv1_90049 [Candidatus Thorarchaeota archaeon]